MGGNHNENAYATVKTSDGGFIVVGSTHSNNDGDVGVSSAFEGQGGSDYWVAKVNSKGEKQWTKSFGGSDDDVATDIVQAHNGDYVIIGTTVSTDGDANFNGTNGGLLLVRIREDGSKVSSRVIPGGRRFTEPTYAYTDNFSKPSIVKLTNGDLVIGATREIGQSPFVGKQFYLSRLTPFGDTKWERLYGSSKDEVMSDLIVTSDGGLLLLGSTTADAKEIKGAGNGFYDFLAIKTDQNGVEIFKKAWGGSNFDVLMGVVESHARDGYIAVGESVSKDGVITSNKGQKDAIILKIDIYGNLAWLKNIGGEYNESLNGIIKSNDKYLALGTGESQMGDVKPKGPLTDVLTTIIDDQGEVASYGLFGGADIDIARGGIQVTNDELLLVGTSRSESEDLDFNNGGNDFWMLKLGPPPPILFGSLFVNLNNDQEGVVEWSTVLQNDADFMRLEKSTDNKTFEKLRDYSAAENTNRTRLYSYLDRDLNIGQNVYRLRYFDAKGEEYKGLQTTFEFIPLANSPEPMTEVEIFPNPATERISISSLSRNAIVKFIDARGILLPVSPVYTNDKIWEITFNEKVKPGVYLISVFDENQASSHKVVVY